MTGLMPPNQPEEQDGSENVSPEEQAQYDEFVTNGMELIYEQNSVAKIIEAVKATESPAEGIAGALVAVVTRLEDSAEKAGKQFSGDVLYHGGVELLEQMVELVEAAGVKMEEPDIEAALYSALDQYRVTRQQQGKLPVDELSASMEEMQAADQRGELDQLVPGASDAAKRLSSRQPKG